MRKITAGLHISLDGVVESPEKWTRAYFNNEMLETMQEGVKQADAVLLGRRTYEMFSRYWPSKADTVPMAAFLNHTPKYVVSSTLDKLDWADSCRITGDLGRELMNLKCQPGKNIQIPGGPSLVRSLLCCGLLDELALFVFPIVVGGGQGLFDKMNLGARLKLVDARTFSTGAQALSYQVATA